MPSGGLLHVGMTVHHQQSRREAGWIRARRNLNMRNNYQVSIHTLHYVQVHKAADSGARPKDTILIEM